MAGKSLEQQIALVDINKASQAGGLDNGRCRRSCPPSNAEQTVVIAEIELRRAQIELTPEDLRTVADKNFLKRYYGLR